MVVNVAEAVEFVREVAQNEQVRITVQGSLKGGLLVGCAAAFGGVCLGPPGIALGGVIGAAVAAKDAFKPLPEVIADMSPGDKERLARRVERIVQDFEVADVAQLAMMAAGSSQLKEKMVQELIHYLTHEMQIAIA